MKNIKISLAMLGMLIGTVASLAFKAPKKDTPCVSGPASFVSQCANTNTHLCCKTANNQSYNGPFTP